MFGWAGACICTMFHIIYSIVCGDCGIWTIFQDVIYLLLSSLHWPTGVCRLSLISSHKVIISEISYPSGSRARDAPPSSEASSSSAAFWVSPDMIKEYFDGDILRPGVDAVFFCAYSFLPIWRDILAMVAVSSSLSFARAQYSQRPAS